MATSLAKSQIRSAVGCGLATAATAGLLCLLPISVRGQTIEQLRNLSIEQLGEIKVTSVLKSPEPLSDAPAAIYVITHDEIMNSGFVTIPDILRLAPNLQVAQVNSFTWQITARGFNVDDNASMSNKLLVLVDGRSVYSPMFGGVYWDMLNIPPEDIERIEVISGPGATLWGANAVNGVINIITLPSAATQGGTLTVGAGNVQRDVLLQYGGQLGPDLTYRAYGTFFNSSSFPLSNGKSANDAWSQPGGGFRLDWTPRDDTVSLQGDYASETEGPEGFNKETDAAVSWNHRFADGSSVHLLAYFDDSLRSVNDGSAFDVKTYDIEMQHNFTVAGWNSIVWGVGERNFNYAFENTALALIPPKQDLNLANVFGQDTISLSARLKLTVGLKLEDEPFAGLQAMPSVRLAWKVTDATLLWGAISRAVRSPTPVDTNLVEFSGGAPVLAGSTSFRPETLIAYELGTRMQLSQRASFSVSGYYDSYDHLRSINPGVTVPYVFGNLMTGTVYGIQVWGDYQPVSWWRLTAGISALHESFQFLPGALTVAGLAFVANDPPQQATLQSTMMLGHGVTLFADLREVGALPHPVVPGYVEMDARVGWKATKSLELSLSGFNLIHAQHLEFVNPGLEVEVPRSVLVQARVGF